MILFLLDIDGTLLTTYGKGKEAFKRAWRDLFQEDIELDREEVLGRTDFYIFKKVLLKRGYEVEKYFDLLKKKYLEHLKEITSDSPSLLGGVEEFLYRYRDHPWILLGLLTGNFREGAKYKLGKYFSFFPVGGFGDFAENREEIFIEVLQDLKRKGFPPPERIVLIGDTPLDIHCAREFGAYVIAISSGSYRRYELSEADMILNSFLDWPFWGKEELLFQLGLI